MKHPPHFPPTDEALAERIAAVDVRGYGRTRNHVNGEVTRLSPYITHGFIDLPVLRDHLVAYNGLAPDDKLMQEFGWREFFSHVHKHHGECIFSDLRPPLPGVGYARDLPADLREGRTGIPAIDRAVSLLYRTGWLHNHARLWLASYTVHVRHVSWRAGADWMYAHLLDGDLASNHLSWQWVAGTFSTKPYLFNADNVARFAPTDWHSPGTAIDTSYEVMERIARGLEAATGIGAGSDGAPEQAGTAPGNDGPRAGIDDNRAEPPPVIEPPPLAAPPDALLADCLRLPCWRFARPGDLPELAHMLAADPARPVELVHPWRLAARPGASAITPAGRPAAALRVGVIHLPFHARFPWSAARWRFVLGRLGEVCDVVVLGDLATLAPMLAGRADVLARATANPGYDSALAALATRLEPVPRCFTPPAGGCDSFSRFWKTQGSAPHQWPPDIRRQK